jgi:hypothetical protein
VPINGEKVKRSRKAIKEIQQTGKNSERLINLIKIFNSSKK